VELVLGGDVEVKDRHVTAALVERDHECLKEILTAIHRDRVLCEFGREIEDGTPRCAVPGSENTATTCALSGSATFQVGIHAPPGSSAPSGVGSSWSATPIAFATLLGSSEPSAPLSTTPTTTLTSVGPVIWSATTGVLPTNGVVSRLVLLVISSRTGRHEQVGDAVSPKTGV
jgi:hypothetical protein